MKAKHTTDYNHIEGPNIQFMYSATGPRGTILVEAKTPIKILQVGHKRVEILIDRDYGDLVLPKEKCIFELKQYFKAANKAKKVVKKKGKKK